jgi:hypothetical protein
MPITTKVGLNRLKDFSIFEGRIGTVIESYSSTPPAGCLYIGEENTEVSKTEWSELYEAIGGSEGSSPDKFVLPYKADDGKIKHYLVGKVLLSEITTSGNVVVATFSQDNIDADGCYTFIHGIGHIHPILQLFDQNGDEVILSKVNNTIGQSKVQITSVWRATIRGNWTILAIG